MVFEQPNNNLRKIDLLYFVHDVEPNKNLKKKEDIKQKKREKNDGNENKIAQERRGKGKKKHLIF